MLNVYNFPSVPIGNILISRGLISSENVGTILKVQRSSDMLFGQLAVNLGFLNENDLLSVLSDLYQMPAINMEFLYIKNEILNSISREIAEFCRAVPFFLDDKVVKIAIADPGNLQAIDKINSHFRGLAAEFFVAKESDILHFIEIMKCNTDYAKDNPLFLLNKIIFEALEYRASDIHFEPLKNFVRVRLRIDGILTITESVDYESWSRIQAKLKLITNLNIMENRRPQSGHARIYLAGRIVDLRISTHPGIFGEDFVIRVFDLSNGVKSLDELGFSLEDFLWLKKITSFPSGIFLVVGPTGSGKTTTLYSLLKEMNSTSVNIMTMEDPIEYQIDGIRQLELKEEGLLSFADGVKSILRQDPDVMLIGEIRDEETAAVTVRASLTGRLVLATLHAATPIEGMRRLMDLGVRMVDFVPLLVGIFSQRLVRRSRQDENDSQKCTGRFPLSEYIYFSDELKQQLLLEKDLNLCRVDKTFKSSIREALEHQLVSIDEIRRVFGDLWNADI
ncbi:MAG: Flp pilus assembly complex ATPase component TadA [Holosporaceae bacterium]|jgi:type II secretory ATPase GspE/PulE/Tfp pilus assembly ATPase PilB-like protein|nr:Flp pilus assembly complex ATPase component TadA [Holosporaceae bacterium]